MQLFLLKKGNSHQLLSKTELPKGSIPMAVIAGPDRRAIEKRTNEYLSR